MIRITQVEREHIAQLRAMLDEYIAFLRHLQTDVIDQSAIPGLRNVDDEFAALPGVFAPPSGRLLVALDGDTVIGCVALKPMSETTGEVKRMYVKPEYRGQQIGWRLIETMVAAAREIGYRRLVLDSHINMTQAHRVYHGQGFRDVPTPDAIPDDLRKTIVFMALDLSDGAN